MAQDTILTVKGRDREFVVRVIQPGERHGRDRVLTAQKPLVQFFDHSFLNPQGDQDERVYGQATGGVYYLQTLLEHQSNTSLALDLGISAWTVPAEAMDEVLHFLRHSQPDPTRGRVSLLAN